jgi:hypothetical protein
LALGEVQRDTTAHTQIYDVNELGLLQAGLTDMVRDLAERQRLGDLFGRYVGEDVAVAIFGALIEHPDISGAALTASRELHDDLVGVLEQTDFGIRVSTGQAIAGHIGAQTRFEYTVSRARKVGTCSHRLSQSAGPSMQRRCAGTSGRSSNYGVAPRLLSWPPVNLTLPQGVSSNSASQ